MDDKRPLLSICIPTYNRAEYLKDALDNITSDSSFDERVEIVVSDNASTDETSSVVEKYTRQYSNVYYFRNAENIKDKNFILSLSRGRGKYIRLFNDTLRFKDGALNKILEVITASSETHPLFFFQNVTITGCVNDTYETKGANGLLSKASFYITWIANFGCWKSNVEKINNADRCASLQLAQVDWFLQIAEANQKSKICFGDFFITISPARKGGYNIFKVFLDNYLSILKDYKISCIYYKIEKYRLMRYFIIPWWIRILKDENLTFSMSEKWGILFKYYKFSPYFYLFLLYYGIKYNLK